MKILILKCTDPRMWYNSLVGQQVHVEREDSDYFWCREIEGYLNIVLKTDATVVSISLSDLMQK